MSKIALSVENLSKQYRLGEIGTGTISHDLNRWWAKMRGKEDPFSLVGQENDRSKKAESDFVWALRDINFKVEQGEVLGIIGKNGAGKSTLLKLISRITAPSQGFIKAKGRIASLLEVGTGMHPEMTARENIFLNGAIMGMTKKEIRRKFDEIVDFAGCAMYIDTPVKRYSSGMRVRLGFAVAAFLEPEILIVDEVLAVGDAEFQKKAVGKMKDVSSGEGRTVLFVSHNMGSVRALCNKGLVLKNGKMQFQGTADAAVQNYLDNYVEENREIEWSREEAPGTHEVKLLSAKVKKAGASSSREMIEQGDAVELDFVIEKLTEGEEQVDFTFHFYDEMNNFVFMASSALQNDIPKSGKGLLHYKASIPANLLHEGNYSLDKIFIVKNKASLLYRHGSSLNFEVVRKISGFGWQGAKEGVVKPDIHWSLEQL
ncbi:ABC-type polysaccharide/polyol phosphate transport system, ATPase component [Saprospira grandis DSM 2844]|uniref:ABC-type polysaccharide/polyol phosphate transport system, ATPase component n=1 Tax=Saprospira grandis DSM 2844 TaxID=694433 RepID=J0Y077_9BACT|nr:ABC transporter ATP-binding protein [Saprospira grandis]EJF54921.1 ABC-type polysaccharide/polyol phosphate transport system, ATPase component [Saprospira grandis DSM 2844]